MLDKQVVKFTRDGIQKKNLATGETEMLTESDHAKQIRYNPLQTVYNGRRFAQPLKPQNKTLQSYKAAAAYAKMAAKKTQNSEIYKSDSSGTATEKSVAAAARGQSKPNSSNKTPDKNLSPKERSKLYSKALAKQKRKQVLSTARQELKNMALDSLSDSDDLGLQTVGQGYRAAEDIEKASKVVNQWQKKIRTNRQALKQVRSKTTKQVAEQTAKKATRDAIMRQQAIRTANAAKTATAQKVGTTAVKNIAGTAAKAAGGPYVAIAAAAIFVLLMIMQLVSSFTAATSGSADTELTAYVKQLDTEFLQKVSDKKAEYEKQPNTDVKVIGMDSVHTDATELALLATAEWSMIDLTDANKQLLKTRYDVMHTYEVTETNDSSSSEVSSEDSDISASVLSLLSDVSSQITASRHITITIHNYSPEEKIDAFGFSPGQKKRVLEALPVLRQINAAMGATGSIIIEGNGEYAWPVPGFTYISSQFGEVVDRSKPHPGVDIAGENIYGKPIVAAADGTITEVTSGWGGGYGNSVLIDHGNGYTTRYGHCSSVAVHTGQVVKKGQVIAYVGSTGDSTGPHCHFEIRKDGTPINPMPFITGMKGANSSE